MRKRDLHPFVEAVRASCRHRALLAEDDRALVALSAGPDSTALVAALAALRDLGALAGLSALHVDHGLRPGSAEDARAAAETCRQLRVPFATVRVTVGPGNVQAQARAVRYRALQDEAERVGATRIATGHTRTDQAETVLLRLLRGAGTRGLSGIPPRRGPVVRPLIDRSRAEVLAYLRDLGLPFREDPTNTSPRYARNRIRHELSPVLARLAPAAERSLSRAADLLREDERALVALAKACAPGAGVARARLLAEPEAVRRRVVRLLWRRAAAAGAELSADHVEEVLARLPRAAPWRLSLPGGVEARGRYGQLELGPGSAGRPPAPSPWAVALPGPGRYPLPGRPGVLLVTARDPALVPWPLDLRTRLPGDRIHPEGGGGKKLKAWMIDRKVPRERRDSVLVVASGATVLALPELGVRSREVGTTAGGLEVRVEPG
ncbi:MAG TPA: tRNA lysidine(34) synthetase TilS [Anaeromyxobacter sp.]|nr:tRNA lysidine(34) synthetase TilS [Anaeromyxobacter sp.]